MITWLPIDYNNMPNKETEILVWVDDEDGYPELVFFSKKYKTFDPMAKELQRKISHWSLTNKPVELKQRKG